MNQHIIYVPKRPLEFKWKTPDGNMALVFEGKLNIEQRAATWIATTAACIPATIMACYYLEDMYLYAMLFGMHVPNAYYFFDGRRAKEEMESHVKKMYVYRNGSQLLLETYDGVLHKINIIDSESSRIGENPRDKKSLLFTMTNSGRSFHLSNKDVDNMDYDLVDRVVRGIAVDTKRSQKVFHHLLAKQIPENLKPEQFSRHQPSISSGQQIHSNKTVW